MNRIVNQFGAPNMENTLGCQVQQLSEQLAFDMRTIMMNNALEPDEIIAFERQMVQCVADVSEKTLLFKAAVIRQQKHRADAASPKVKTFNRRTPAQWCEFFGLQVIDPDGWPLDGSPSWDTPISGGDFKERCHRSTCRVVNPENYFRWKHYLD
jgi:hypothetical protein